MEEPVSASSLAAEAYGIVRQRILRGDIVLGDPISRRRLASELGMSFLPVSEALLRLECEGLIESRPRAGTRVRIPTPEDVTGHFVIREALEVQAVILFTERATSAERVELRRLSARVDALATRADRSMYIELHKKLHRQIAESARCRQLSDAIEKTHALASMWLCAARQLPPGSAEHRHQDLIAAVTSSDSDAAARAMRAHMAVGLEHALKALEPYFGERDASGRSFSRGPRHAR